MARQAFASVGDWLGVGTANLVAALDPEVVVIGGGVSAAGDKLLDPARAALRRTLVGAAHRRVPDLVAATLGPRAGMIGAALLVQRSRASAASVVGHQLERELLEEEPDVGDDAAALVGPAVRDLGDGARVDVDAHERHRRGQDVAGGDRVQLRRHHQAVADVGDLRAHRPLPLEHVGVDVGERAVVADRAHQHEALLRRSPARA